jgi:ABC-type branched-subunit amino acid transport system substrate-binding protein
MTDELSRRELLKRSGVGLGGLVIGGSFLAACGSDGDGGSGGSGSGGGGGGSALKIGVLAPITGSLAPYGVAIKNGMEVSADLINADGGINGKDIEFILLDDKTDPKTATSQARKLLTQDRVDVLMGTTSSATTLAVIPQAEAAKTPFMWNVEGEDKNCSSDGATRPLIFGNAETPEQKMEKFVPYMLENLGKRVYFIGSDYVFPHFVNDTTKALVEKHGGSTAGTAYAPLGTSDFSSYIPKIEQANPDVIFISVVGTDGVALVKQATEFGLRKNAEFAGIPSFSAEVYPGIKDVAQGIYTVDRYWDGLDNPVNKAFVDAYRGKFGSDAPVSGTSAMGTYGSLLLWKAAVEKAGDTDGEKIAEALPGLSAETPGGTVTIDPENNIARTPMRLLRITDNGYEMVEDFGEVAHPGHSGCSSKDV